MPTNIPEDEDHVLVMVVKDGHALASKTRHQKELPRHLFLNMIPQQILTIHSVLPNQVVCIGLRIKRSGPPKAAELVMLYFTYILIDFYKSKIKRPSKPTSIHQLLPKNVSSTFIETLLSDRPQDENCVFYIRDRLFILNTCLLAFLFLTEFSNIITYI